MVGILVATHGRFAEGLLNAVELIAGKQEKTGTIGLFHGDGIWEFEDRMKMLIRELDDGDGVLVFVDILGGSPANTVMKCLSMNHEIRAIAGVNMGMLVQAVMMGTEQALRIYVIFVKRRENKILFCYIKDLKNSWQKHRKWMMRFRREMQ